MKKLLPIFLLLLLAAPRLFANCNLVIGNNGSSAVTVSSGYSQMTGNYIINGVSYPIFSQQSVNSGFTVWPGNPTGLLGYQVAWTNADITVTFVITYPDGTQGTGTIGYHCDPGTPSRGDQVLWDISSAVKYTPPPTNGLGSKTNWLQTIKNNGTVPVLGYIYDKTTGKFITQQVDPGKTVDLSMSVTVGDTVASGYYSPGMNPKMPDGTIMPWATPSAANSDTPVNVGSPGTGNWGADINPNANVTAAGMPDTQGNYNGTGNTAPGIHNSVTVNPGAPNSDTAMYWSTNGQILFGTNLTSAQIAAAAANKENQNQQVLIGIGTNQLAQGQQIIGLEQAISNAMNQFNGHGANSDSLLTNILAALRTNGPQNGASNYYAISNKYEMSSNVWVMNWPSNRATELTLQAVTNLLGWSDTNAPADTNGLVFTNTPVEYPIAATDTNAGAAESAASVALATPLADATSAIGGVSVLRQTIPNDSEPDMTVTWSAGNMTWALDLNPVHHFWWAFALSHAFFTWLLVILFLKGVLECIYQVIQDFAAAQTGAAPNMVAPVIGKK